MGRVRRRWVPGVLTAACLFFPASAAAGTVYTPTRPDDPNPDGCAPTDCSLREAVIAANANADASEIDLPSGTYNLTITGPGDANQGDLDITAQLTIQGQGDTMPVIDAAGLNDGLASEQDRAFEIVTGFTSLDYVHITNGVAPVEGDSRRRGGAIRVDSAGSMQLYNGMVSSSHANVNSGNPGFGGGIYSEATSGSGFVAVTYSIVESNTATGGFGGGVYVKDTSAGVADNSVIRNNSAENGGGVDAAGVFDLLQARFKGNSASLDGGGVYAEGADPSTYDNVNVNNNMAGGTGGGVRIYESSVDITSSTITQNAAASGGGVAVEDVAGGQAAKATLANTILATNTDGSANASDCGQGEPNLFHTAGYNIVGVGTDCSFPTALPDDHVGTSVAPFDPKLGPTLYNGGFPTALLTQMPKAGSAAINGGNPATPVQGPPLGVCDSEDSRGLPRGYFDHRCDIGAVERAKCQGVVINRVGYGNHNVDLASYERMAPTSGADGIVGFSGDDRLAGAGGNDGICGGDDNDRLKGNSGADRLAGGNGRDRLIGGPGRDLLIGGSGHDVCIGGTGHDTARGCEVKRSIP